MQNQDTCGCCEGLTVETPVLVYNRPGLQAITYRTGDYAKFRESLVARLSTSGLAALRGLTTRNSDDFTIALLDAWASVADVLTFYQERIANESYMGTATEQFSIVQLARLIGYELRPGVAAGSFLAFTIEDTPGAAGQMLVSGTSQSKVEIPPINIDLGAKVQSIPGPNEKPQTFETIEPIAARAEWNAIKPRLSQPQHTIANNSIIVVDGTANDLKAGDILLVTTSSNEKKIRLVLQAIIDTDTKTTRVYVDLTPSFAPFPAFSTNPNGDINSFTETTITSNTINNILNKIWKEEEIATLIQTKKWPVVDFLSAIAKEVAARADTQNTVLVFRKRASVFGYNAIKQVTYTTGNTPNIPAGIPNPQSLWSEWPLCSIDQQNTIYLDSVYDQVLPGSYIGVQHSHATIEDAIVYQAVSVNIRSRSDYGISMKTTAITLPQNSIWQEFGNDGKKDLSSIRSITVHAQSVPVVLAESPINDVIAGSTVMLDKLYLGLQKDQLIVLSGNRDDLKGAAAIEVRTLKNVFIVNGFTVLEFDDPLTYAYIRASVTINANIAKATHGETVKEVMGSGNASALFQQFVLKQSPLTFISASTASGTQSTLEIRVNDILWHEVPSLYGHGPSEHIYITRLDDAGNTTVIFGDGKTGARLPTGQENIKATYRKGIGEDGLLKANQLSQLLTRPLGVKAATNPLPTSGAENRESLSDARRNATLTIFTLDRIVSLKDYEDFARAFAGISKALATWGWLGQKRYVYLTVAGVNGAAVANSLYDNLLAAILAAGIPNVPITIFTFQPRFFRLAAKILVDPDYIFDNVAAAVTQQLQAVFSFGNRDFGQSVVFSKVISTIQNVAGVVAVDLDSLYFSTDAVPSLNERLDAKVPQQGAEKTLPAELLMIDPAPIDLKPML